jgi:hypothetical protein
MATAAFLDAFAHVGSHDFTCDSNNLMATMDGAVLDRTTFCSGGWQQVRGGLKSSTFNMARYWAAGADSVDETAFADLGPSNRVITFGPSATEGGVAYFWRSQQQTYKAFGAHGELTPFDVSAVGSDAYGIIRGQVAATKQIVDATGVLGSVVNLGDVDADEHLYASFHVFGTPGTTITVLVQSAPDGTFAAPTTRATIGPLTAAGGVWVPRVAGAITDTHWRLNVSAITGEFTVAGALAVA